MLFEVTVTRTGCVIVEADNASEAMEIVDDVYGTDDISWSDDWETTDAIEYEE